MPRLPDAADEVQAALAPPRRPHGRDFQSAIADPKDRAKSRSRPSTPRPKPCSRRSSARRPGRSSSRRRRRSACSTTPTRPGIASAPHAARTGTRSRPRPPRTWPTASAAAARRCGSTSAATPDNLGDLRPARLPPRLGQARRPAAGQVHPARPGRSHRSPEQPADGPRDGQPRLAAPLRPRPRRHAEQLRQARRPADPPRTARQPRRRLRGKSAGRSSGCTARSCCRATYRLGSAADAGERAPRIPENAIPVAGARRGGSTWRRGATRCWPSRAGSTRPSAGRPCDLAAAANVRRTIYAKVSRLETRRHAGGVRLPGRERVQRPTQP